MTDQQLDIRQASYMSDTEALMWSAEQDPFLSSGMGSIFVLDSAVDLDRLTARMVNASRTMRRLRERVERTSFFSPPRWVTDHEFDIEDHIRHVRLPDPGTRRELLDLAAHVFQDPFDQSRPLWQFVVVDGSGSRRKDAVKGALIAKIHHAVSDGIGALRLAELYLDLERNPPDAIASAPDSGPPAVPLQLAGDDDPDSPVHRVVEDVEHVLRRQLGIARSAAAELALWGADPARARRTAGAAISVVRSLGSQASPRARGVAGSALWKNRSRHRRIEVLDVPLDAVKRAARALGGSVNDFCVAGSVLAASRHHAARGDDPDRFTLSFIVSTRNDEAAGGNSFAPLPFTVDAAVRSPEETFASVRDVMVDVRGAPRSGLAEGMEIAASFANVLPDSLIGRVGRARSAGQEWATSTLMATPFPVFVAGAEITHMYPVGPVAGTAFNLTAMSYNGTIDFGVLIDPVAVDDPEGLRRALEVAYADLLRAGGA